MKFFAFAAAFVTGLVIVGYAVHQNRQRHVPVIARDPNKRYSVDDFLIEDLAA